MASGPDESPEAMTTLQRSRSEATAYRLQAEGLRTSVMRLADRLPLAEISPAVLDACQMSMDKADLLDRFALVAESQV